MARRLIGMAALGTVALLVSSMSASKAEAFLFGHHRSGCCEQRTACCAPVRTSCCQPVAVRQCAPAPACCNPAPVCAQPVVRHCAAPVVRGCCAPAYEVPAQGAPGVEEAPAPPTDDKAPAPEPET